MITNEWILYTDYLAQRSKWNTDECRFWCQSGMKLEYMLDGKIIKRKDGGYLIGQEHVDNDREWAERMNRPREYSDDDVGKIHVWNEERDEYDVIDASNYYIRMNQKLFDKYVELKDTVQVGDFVRFSGSKGYKWRKIIEIKGNTLFGQCASKPDDSGLVFHSSDNGILTAVEVVRNGQKIFY